MTDQSPNQRVVIAGGGIGGLATALALAQAGFQVDVFEKREAHHEEGAGIQIGPNGSHILSALGVSRYLEDKFFQPESLVVHDGRSGRVLTRFPLGNDIAQRFGSPYWTIHRHHLHEALVSTAQASPNIRIALASEVRDFEQNDHTVEITTDNGAKHSAGVLIAADGLWSRLRREICSGSEIEPVGKCAYRTVIKRLSVPVQLRDDNVHVWLLPGRHCVHYPVDGGRATACVFIFDHAHQPKGWDVEAEPELLAAKFSDSPPLVIDLISSASGWRSWSLHSMESLPSWTYGRAALIGDAAHPILPFLAQGAVMALEDSVVLAQCLKLHRSDLPDGLRSFEQARKARLDAIARASSQNGKIYQLTGIRALARNAALETIPPRLFMRRYDWVYGWRPETASQ